jgi:2-polyprenyl-6-methoxyphenol hydroxylase-like FAD-dependent oxidoreductase
MLAHDLLDTSHMRAVICGAGVAGLTLASELGRAGWKVVLLDRESGPADGGYLVDLTGEGLLAAQRMFLLPALRDTAQPVSRVCWVDGTGKIIANVGIEGAGSSRGIGALKILRGDLERVLLQNLPPSVDLRFGFDVAEMRTPPGRVELTLRPGGRLTADLLIGADGVHSHIRDLVFGDGGLWSRTLGYDTAAFVFEDRDVRRGLAGTLTVFSVPGRHIVLCPLRGGKIAATLIHRSASMMPPDAPRDHLQRVYAGQEWCVPALLNHVSRATDLRYEQAVQIKLPVWHRGRIGLLGDACHAYSLLPGQGSSIAMAAAFRLAQDLIQAPSVDIALGWYQIHLAGEMARRRAFTRRAAQWLIPASRTELAFRTAVLRIASLPGVQRLLGPAVGGIA